MDEDEKNKVNALARIQTVNGIIELMQNCFRGEADLHFPGDGRIGSIQIKPAPMTPDKFEEAAKRLK